MVFGGSMHPDQDDRFHWLANEEEFLADVLAVGAPVFGVCLGAQMLARAAGAGVRPASAPEIGWLDVSLTQEICTQAFRLADLPAWGIQFHAEVTLPMVTAWTEEDPDELPMPASELRARSAEVMAASNAQGRALAEAFLHEAAASV